MACPRCGDEAPITPRWCPACDRAYDAWSRQHATDIVWEALSGTVLVLFFGMGLPLLGASVLVSAAGIFAGFGTILGVHRFNQRRRRRQFLAAGDMPRAYLPGKT